jgi:hypothetical protein
VNRFDAAAASTSAAAVAASITAVVGATSTAATDATHVELAYGTKWCEAVGALGSTEVDRFVRTEASVGVLSVGRARSAFEP